MEAVSPITDIIYQGATIAADIVAPTQTVVAPTVAAPVSRRRSSRDRRSAISSDYEVYLNEAVVEAMPSRPTVGMDLIFENVWRCLIEEDQVRIIGLYGMGGVGKTTLLKKINNEFDDRGTNDFDVVIWVVVSKESNVRMVQKTIGEPPVGIVELVELLCLNLSGTSIHTLPDELKILVQLKYLDLSYTNFLSTIPIKVILRLPRLQVLNIYTSSYGDWEVDGDNVASLVESGSLKHLNDTGITIRTVPFLEKFFNFHNLSRCTSYLLIERCKDLEELTFSWVVVTEGENTIPLNLETLILTNLPKLKIIRDVAHPFFQNFAFIQILNCDALKDLT
ncbi:hypothetical protein HHK36_026790 [Tetracentron sinense]|uniref:NB-ARC domain-containing protein n=1 Tax=Tetracentron sinense TaxID=13715 RepID=A0A834YFN3_TETSI|nr:hypothetical protein HHK36_026790 [Tetracentron sinense]